MKNIIYIIPAGDTWKEVPRHEYDAVNALEPDYDFKQSRIIANGDKIVFDFKDEYINKLFDGKPYMIIHHKDKIGDTWGRTQYYFFGSLTEAFTKFNEFGN